MTDGRSHQVRQSEIVQASPQEILDVVLTAEHLDQWWPLPITVNASGRLHAGDSCQVRTDLPAHAIDAEIRVIRADDDGFYVEAFGPLNFRVDVTFCPIDQGLRVDIHAQARSGGGLKGRLLMVAAAPLMGPGLHRAVSGIKRLAEIQ